MMRTFFARLMLMLAMVYVFTNGFWFLLSHETSVSPEEIVITRIGVIPLESTEYVVNRTTGDEEITISSLFRQQYMSVSYKGECMCVEEIYDKKGGYYLFALGDEVYYRTGKTVRQIISRESARPYFDKGLALRNEMRKKYAHLFD